LALTDLQIFTLVEKYRRERDRFQKMTDRVAATLRRQLRDAAIHPILLAHRTKDPDSLENKLSKGRAKLEYGQIVQEFNPTLLDLAAARILIYRPSDEKPVLDLIEECFEVPEGERYTRDHDNKGGYKASHRVVQLRGDEVAADPELENLQGVLCEIQVATIANHIWNELEHDICYKTPNGKPNREQESLLAVLRVQVDAVLSNVGSLVRATEEQIAEATTEITTPEELRRALELRYKRSLLGDFGRLLRLLDGSFREPVRAVIDSLDVTDDDLKTGLTVARETMGNDADDVDDVMAYVTALWEQYGANLRDVASAWRGRRSPLARLIRALPGGTDREAEPVADELGGDNA